MAKDVIARLKADTSQWDPNLRKGKSAVDNLSSSLLNMAKGYAAAATAGLSFAAAIRNNVNTAMQFEKSMSSLSSLTGMTGQSLDDLKNKAIELGGKTTQTASEVADSFRMIGSAMPQLLESTSALANVTEQVIKLSEAAGIDMATASRTLSTSINQLGASSSQAERYVNVLAAASQKGAGDISWLGEAITNSGTAAKAVGTDYEELVANLEQLAQAGYDASSAGTALRSIIMNLEKQSNNNLKPSVVGLTTAFENLGKEHLTLTGYQEVAGKLFAAQAKTLAENAVKARELQDAITGTNTAEEQAATNTNNLDGSLKSLDSAWEALNLHINDSNGFLKMTVDWLKEIVVWADQAFTTMGKITRRQAEIAGDKNKRMLDNLEAASAGDRARVNALNDYEYNTWIQRARNRMNQYDPNKLGQSGLWQDAYNELQAIKKAKEAYDAAAKEIMYPTTGKADSPTTTTTTTSSSTSSKTYGIKGMSADPTFGLAFGATESMKELNAQLKYYNDLLYSAKNSAEQAFAQKAIEDTKKAIEVQPIALSLGVSTSQIVDIKSDIDNFFKENPIELLPTDYFTKFNVGGVIADEAKDVEKSWAGASNAISAAGSALGQIEDPGAKIAGIIGQALATLASTFAMSLKGTVTPWDWIAAAISGASTLASISGVMKKSVEYHADGGVVGMNSLRRGTDTVPAMLTPGEIVLSAANQKQLASNLQGGSNIQVSGGDVRFSGEDMFYSIKAFMGRTGSTF